MVIDSNKTVGNIVADDYRTAGVFSQLGIDFCCKGNRTIDEVCAKKGIDKYALLDELERVTANNNNQGIDFKSWELDLLIDYIEKKHFIARSCRCREMIMIRKSLAKTLFPVKGGYKECIRLCISHLL